MPIIVQITLGKEEKDILTKLLTWLQSESVDPAKMVELVTAGDNLKQEAKDVVTKLNTQKGVQD